MALIQGYKFSRITPLQGEMFLKILGENELFENKGQVFFLPCLILFTL